MARAFEYEFDVPADAIDANDHVNNVEYVRWMQEAAVRHFDSIRGSELMERAGATWVVRAHHVEYLRPAMRGERIRVRTWVKDFRRVMSTRQYEFVRAGDGTVLAKRGDGMGVRGRENGQAEIDSAGDPAPVAHDDDGLGELDLLPELFLVKTAIGLELLLLVVPAR